MALHGTGESILSQRVEGYFLADNNALIAQARAQYAASLLLAEGETVVAAETQSSYSLAPVVTFAGETAIAHA